MNGNVNVVWQDTPLPPQEEHSDISQACYILNHLFEGFGDPFAVRLWDNSMHYVGIQASTAMHPAFVFHIKHASVLRGLVLFSGPARLAEAYYSGEIDIQGDFNAALRLHDYVASHTLPIQEKLDLVFRALTLVGGHLQAVTANPQPASGELAQTRPNPAALPHAFFQTWMGEHLLHGSGFFHIATAHSQPAMTLSQQNGLALEQAQRNQFEMICRKLRLQHGEALLDIDCGWGGLTLWAAKHYGVTVHAITQNPAQYDYVVAQVQQQALEKQVIVELLDYRDLPDAPCYDKVACIGLLEQGDKTRMAAVFGKTQAVLKTGGAFLYQALASELPERQDTLTESKRFGQLMQQYVFPEGQLYAADMHQQAEAAKFEISQVESLHRHGARTLRHWLTRLEAHHDAITRMVGERDYRIWRLYLAGCATQFEQGNLGLYQLLAIRKQHSLPHLPFVRKSAYAD